MEPTPYPNEPVSGLDAYARFVFGIGRPTPSYLDAAIAYIEKSWPGLAAEPPLDDLERCRAMYVERSVPGLTPRFRLRRRGVARVMAILADPESAKESKIARAVLVAMFLLGAFPDGSVPGRDVNKRLEYLPPFARNALGGLSEMARRGSGRGVTYEQMREAVYAVCAAGGSARADVIAPASEIFYGVRGVIRDPDPKYAFKRLVRAGYIVEVAPRLDVPETYLDLVPTRRRFMFELERRSEMSELGRHLLRRKKGSTLRSQRREGHRVSQFAAVRIAEAMLLSAAPGEISAVAQEYHISLTLRAGQHTRLRVPEGMVATRLDLAAWRPERSRYTPALTPTIWVELQRSRSRHDTTAAQSHAHIAGVLAERDYAAIDLYFCPDGARGDIKRVLRGVLGPRQSKWWSLRVGIVPLREALETAPWLAPSYEPVPLLRWPDEP